MQDIHSIGGSASTIAGASLFLAGSSSGGDRRLRPHSNQNNQLLKCPRCDSSNTKFCYYNNYNLSQPRHFCKNCRRYWTKGGVLRNVPVGGGCRKAKRSSSSKTKQTTPSSLEAVVVAVKDGDSNSHSSSDSSSLTATTTAANTVVADASAITVISSNLPTNLLNFPQSKLFMPQINQNQASAMSHMVSSSSQIFPEAAGSFTSLMTSPPGESSLLSFNFADVSAYNQMQQNQTGHIEDEELKMDHSTINYGYSEQTGQIGYSNLEQNRVTIGGLAGLNWQFDGVGGGEEETGEDQDQGLFDFSGSDDQANYLVQNHWSDNDPSLNFPPLV